MTLPELQIWVCDGFSKPVYHLLLGYRQGVRHRTLYLLTIISYIYIKSINIS
nr:MAG TPA: hypothetical protein [Caudoviricetes sp.]